MGLNNKFMGWYLFFFCLLLLYSNSISFLLYLVCLEVFMMKAFLIFAFLKSKDIIIKIFILVLATSEATMGLSILVKSSNVSLSMLNTNKIVYSCEGY